MAGLRLRNNESGIMDNLKISVIIPVYNVEKYIHRCVDSVLNQTYQNIEVILVDDGSQDRSPVICDEYVQKDSRVRVFHKINGGQSSARNLALDNMTGDYVSFIDCDDYIEQSMLGTLLTSLRSKNGDVAICLEKRDDEKKFEGDIYRNILEDKIGSQVWRYLFKADLFGEIRFCMGRYAEDIALLDKILYGKKIIYVPERFYNYTYDNSQSSSNNKQYKYKNTVDRAVAFIGRYLWVRDKNDISDGTKLIVLYHSVNFSLATFCRCKNSNYDIKDLKFIFEFLRDYKKEILKLRNLKFYKKFAVRLLLKYPKLYCSIGVIIDKRK